MNIQSALVHAILTHYHSYQWTVQGFGMLRTKIANVGRIHIWDARLRVPLVSDIHAHPWDLRSQIISGELINQRFDTEREEGGEHLLYLQSIIATGEGGGLRGEPIECMLIPREPEFYSSGYSYTQRAEEVHRTIPMDGTVTLMEREQGPPLQETHVFYPRGTTWVSAEPRPAKDWEVDAAIGYALKRWSGA